jgi:hypothetical protein
MPNQEVTIKNPKGYTAEISGQGELLVSAASLNKIVASAGVYICNDTTEVTKTIGGILTLEDTVFTSIKVAGTDVKASYISTPATAVKAGAYITGLGVNFSGVKLASGSVSLVLV